MIPANAVASQIQAYLKSQDVQQLVQAVDAVPDIAALFTVGEQLHATVTGQLNTGRFTVLVKDQLLDLNLPRNTQPGEELDLQVLADSPKLTFLLQGRTAPVAGKNLPLPQAANEAPSTPARPQTETVDLSKTAQFVGELLQETAHAGDDKRPLTAATQNIPALINTNKPDTTQLADKLKEVLTQSGLFYESHQAEWISGARDLASLFKEPQAASARGDSGLAASLPAETPVSSVSLLSQPEIEGLMPPQPGVATETPAGAQVLPATTSQLAPSSLLAAAYEEGAELPEKDRAETPSEQVQGSGQPDIDKNEVQTSGVPSKLAVRQTAEGVERSGAKTDALKADTGLLDSLPTGKQHRVDDMPPVIRQLVQQQLESLDRRQFSWVGQAWPGQNMQWDVEEDRQQGRASADVAEPATVWRSRLQLDLPNLGPVTALVTLTGKQQVDVRFSVVIQDTAQRIRDNQQLLGNAMDAAGLQLSSNLVALDAQEGSDGQ